MRRPKYVEELVKIIFLWLGIAFAFTGLLCFMGVLKPRSASLIQESAILGFIFFALAVIFFIVQMILKAITASKDKMQKELLATGMKTSGTVEKVYLQKSMQYGRKSPYRILYTYTCQGKTYQGKSMLLWEKPDFKEGDSIAVYANSFGRSVIQL